MDKRIICPKCKSSYVRFDIKDYDIEEAIVKCGCGKCFCEWEVTYSFKTISIKE